MPTRLETGDPLELHPSCPSHRLMTIIGDQWSITVIIALYDGGEIRSADLKRAVTGISQKMLTQTLRKLERADLVARTIEPTVPVSVSYRLTGLGTSLYAALVPVRAWAQTHLDEATPAPSPGEA